jgi:hypothetical protein
LSYFDEGDGIDPRFAASPDGLVGAGWHHLVTVVRRAPTMRVEHYLNGGRVYAREFGAAAPPLRLGTFRVGGWNPHLADVPDRTLGGAIDDLMIFSRALSDDEVRTLYERSRP